ncbi:MAG: crotonase/enoyl-CoA hydratase family protein [Acidimicrobiales bacterium]
MSDVVRYETEGRVAVITLDRPEARNAIDGRVASGLEAAVDRLEADPDVWVGILAAEGPVFCAGADLKAISQGRIAELSTPGGGFAGFARKPRTKPIIAAVHALAVAGGFELVLSCDLVVASRSAGFALPEVKRALIAGAGGLVRLPRRLPRNVATEIALTGDPITAERAHALGLVNRLCDEGGTLAAAHELAAAIVVNAPVAVRLSKRVIDSADERADDEGFATSGRLHGELEASEDFKEGPLAFIEKRPPRWTGR